MARTLTHTALAIVVLALPAVAGAQGGTFGSPLTAPNVSIGCQTVFTQDFNGNPVAQPSGQPDCTWRQAGFPGGAPAGDPRGSAVPGTGTITQMEVKSGPNPAPLRVTVLSQISAPGGGSGICCFFETETQPFTLTPNAVTAVPLNISVKDTVFPDKRATDILGVSAASNAGDLPVADVGGNNYFTDNTFGNPSVGFFYPRLGPQDGTNTGGRPETGGPPGTEILVRWTWVPPGGSGTPTNPLPVKQNTTPLVGIGLKSGFANIRSGVALVEMLCRGNAICEGQLGIINLGGAAQRKKSSKIYYSKKKKYKIAPGKTAKVKVPLSSKGKRVIKKKRSLKTLLETKPKVGARSTTQLTLRQKK